MTVPGRYGPGLSVIAPAPVVRRVFARGHRRPNRPATAATQAHHPRCAL